MPVTVDLGVSGLQVRAGDHICAFYRGAERDKVLVPFLRAGLRTGDKCIYVDDGAQPQHLLALLDDPLVDERLERHQLELVAFENAYLTGGEFVLTRMVQFWDDNVRSALEGGKYRFVRSAGEMTWALRDLPGVDQLVAYESELNRFVPRYPQVILCLYDIERFSGELILDMLKTHPKVLLGAMVLDNPYYLEPDEFLALRPMTAIARRKLDGENLELRTQLSNLQGLLMLSMLMTESGDERQILRLATSSVAGFARCRLEGAHLAGKGWCWTADSCRQAAARRAVERQLVGVGSLGGAVELHGRPWGWAFPLRSLTGDVGFLVVTAEEAPTAAEQFLLRVMTQQAGIALANARLHAQERATAEELAKVNDTLGATVHALRRGMDIHERLTKVAISGEGQEGIARAVHELTGYSVAVEDRYGNLRAWAGPNQPDPYPKDSPARREGLLRRALASVRPIRDGGRLLAVAQPRGDLLGVLVLVDPAGTAGEHELVALEHGATVLAMELAHLRSLAETELRLRRDLVEELLAGADEESALTRAQALGYDLECQHRVVVVEGHGRGDAGVDPLFHAVRRVAGYMSAGALLMTRTGTVVLLANRDVDWEKLRVAVLHELDGGRCRIGVGGSCGRVGDFPRSYREAQIALSIQPGPGGPDRTTVFDELGVYRLLSRLEDTTEVDRFVRDWLGALLDYDARKRSELVRTLSSYLEHGGSYDATAKALVVHRSTLKYRLQRIRELSDLDLNDPDCRFNLQLATRAWATLRALRC
jgi:sugar diacid utilization regulator